MAAQIASAGWPPRARRDRASETGPEAAKWPLSWTPTSAAGVRGAWQPRGWACRRTWSCRRGMWCTVPLPPMAFEHSLVQWRLMGLASVCECGFPEGTSGGERSIDMLWRCQRTWVPHMRHTCKCTRWCGEPSTSSNTHAAVPNTCSICVGKTCARKVAGGCTDTHRVSVRVCVSKCARGVQCCQRWKPAHTRPGTRTSGGATRTSAARCRVPGPRRRKANCSIGGQQTARVLRGQVCPAPNAMRWSGGVDGHRLRK